ncbi:MAG TPA: DUF6152 family protein [Arenicellales bacterium]|nr:hypothetical protein [Gammaproteobacteria bacterium]MDP6025703.1 DUF6152 family protein [Pseudomonadales bacterium]HJL51588.1 DUF6152 family protein [Arenicellales bacterium]MDP6314818.1 DUF6152 family protein [Pseudomonadales bacterium]MDP7313780.1 DUF6152 family protein [Pseudomonadales bacterium]
MIKFRTRYLPLLTSVLLLCIAPQLSAHHAFSAEFDAETPVTLRGKVIRIEWINPHAWIHIAVVLEDGSTTEWMIEGGTPNSLMRTGINRKSLAIGTSIVVMGYQSKDKNCKPRCKANGRDMTFEDGQKLFMGSSGTGAPTDGSDPKDDR